MTPYLELLRHVVTEGEHVPTRAVLQSTGEKISAVSVFGYQMRVPLAGGFPLLTTKKVSFHNVIHELVWFLRGSTNVRYLQEHNVRIWDQWADPDGNLGPVYGLQWRGFPGQSWPAGEPVSFDQMAQVLADIAAVRDDPAASPRRRLIVSAWNPPQVAAMGLPPCHTLFQFGVLPRGRLSCHLYARSIDAFLGLPYNLASYAALTHLVAAMTGLAPHEVLISFGDLHVYSNHLDAVQEQLEREPLPLPRLEVDPPATLAEVSRANFRLTGYAHHPPIRGEVAV